MFNLLHRPYPVKDCCRRKRVTQLHKTGFSTAAAPRTGLRAVVLVFLLGGCASPGQKFDAAAARVGFEKVTIAGRQFEHAIYLGGECRGCQSMHVYLGSDGTPWINNRPSRRPTSRNPLALRLMAADSTPSIFVGRPCYHEMAQDAECDEMLWTSARYSEAVVDSMGVAIDTYRRRVDAASVVLIGYSGGGAIAVLLADRLDDVSAVVTVAGNLDIDSWTRHHRYEALTDSLNPANLAPLPARVRQMHYAGALDPVVPPATIEKFRKVQNHATFETVPEFDHVCCWESVWPELLEAMD